MKYVVGGKVLIDKLPSYNGTVTDVNDNTIAIWWMLNHLPVSGRPIHYDRIDLERKLWQFIFLGNGLDRVLDDILEV
jgi:hypothetical protein